MTESPQIYVFQCKACRNIFGDSFSSLGFDLKDSPKHVIFSKVMGMIKSEKVNKETEGEMKGWFFKNFISLSSCFNFSSLFQRQVYFKNSFVKVVRQWWARFISQPQGSFQI